VIGITYSIVVTTTDTAARLDRHVGGGDLLCPRGYVAAEVERVKWPAQPPAIWILNPYALNRKHKKIVEVISPRYLGLRPNVELDFGELLDDDKKNWEWNGPVAVYPIQLSDRVRAQRGWFTIHGNQRLPLEIQLPNAVSKIILREQCIREGLRFLDWAGFNRFTIYPDYDSLATWLKQKTMPMSIAKPTRKPLRKGSKASNPRELSAGDLCLQILNAVGASLVRPPRKQPPRPIPACS